MKTTFQRRVVRLAVLVGALVFAAQAAAPRYGLTGSVIANGGGKSGGSGRFAVTGTIAQAEAAPKNQSPNGRYAIRSGFWSWASVVQVPGSPLLKIRLDAQFAVLSWPATVEGFVLQESVDLGNPAGWIPTQLPVVDVNGEHTVTVPAKGVIRTFRLVHP